MIPLFKQTLRWEDYADLFKSVLDSGQFINGPYTTLFETAFADYCQVKACVTVNNGTSALRLMLKAYDIGPGDIVVVPDLTFAATIEAVLSIGAMPLLVDVLASDLTLNPELVFKAIKKPKVIMPVLLYGQWGQLDRLYELAKENETLILADAAQAHGLRKEGLSLHEFCHAAAYSFYPSKNLGAFGDGGAVVSNDEAIIGKIRQLANHGQSIKNYSNLIGENARLGELQAAVLLHKLPKLEENNGRRKQIAYLYDNLITQYNADAKRETHFTLLKKNNELSVHHLYVIQSIHFKADHFIKKMAEKGIECGTHYPYPLHSQEAFANSYMHYFYTVQITKKVCPYLLSLPIYPELTDSQIHFIIEMLFESAEQLANETGSLLY